MEPVTLRCWQTSLAGNSARSFPPCKRRSRHGFRPIHRVLVSEILAHLDYIDEMVDRLSGEVEKRHRPFRDSG